MADKNKKETSIFDIINDVKNVASDTFDSTVKRGKEMFDTVIDTVINAPAKATDTPAKATDTPAKATDTPAKTTNVNINWPPILKPAVFPGGGAGSSKQRLSGRLPHSIEQILANRATSMPCKDETGKQTKPCQKELKISLFFDGTNNHEEADSAVSGFAEPQQDAEFLSSRPYRQAQEIKAYTYPRTTNVARLFHACMGYDATPGRDSDRGNELFLKNGWFKYYIQGVGTRFAEIGDDDPDMAGETGALYGEERINWGLTRLCRALGVSGFFQKRILTLEESGKMVKRMGSMLDSVTGPTIGLRLKTGSPERRKSVLDGFFNSLVPKSNGPMPQSIKLYIIGFSRGAAEARTFANWLLEYLQAHTQEYADKQRRKEDYHQAKMENKGIPPNNGIFFTPLAMGEKYYRPTISPPLKAPDSRTMRLLGIPIHIEMMGLFDTVASVGTSPVTGGAMGTNTVKGGTSGHAGWAYQTMSLRAAGRAGLIKNCYQFVAAHEQRKSFSVDSICIDGGYPQGNFKEYIYPGMHSDVGGGYPPGDQFKANKGMGYVLSQVALHDMYALCWRHGMPLQVWDKHPQLAAELKNNSRFKLNRDEIMDEKTVKEFTLSAELVQRFNAWRDTLGDTKSINSAIEQQTYHITAWRILRWLSEGLYGPDGYARHLGLKEQKKPKDYEESDEQVKANEEIIKKMRKQKNDEYHASKKNGSSLSAEQYEKINAAKKQLSNDAALWKKAKLDNIPIANRPQLIDALSNKNYGPSNSARDLWEAAEEFRADYYGKFYGEKYRSWGGLIDASIIGENVRRSNDVSENAEFQKVHSKGSKQYGLENLVNIQKEHDKRTEQINKENKEKSVLEHTGIVPKPMREELQRGRKEYEAWVKKMQNILQKAKAEYIEKYPQVVKLFDEQVHDSRAWFMRDSAFGSREPFTNYFTFRTVYSGKYSNKRPNEKSKSKVSYNIDSQAVYAERMPDLQDTQMALLDSDTFNIPTFTPSMQLEDITPQSMAAALQKELDAYKQELALSSQKTMALSQQDIKNPDKLTDTFDDHA